MIEFTFKLRADPRREDISYQTFIVELAFEHRND
jgi:hypothetical protein